MVKFNKIKFDMSIQFCFLSSVTLPVSCQADEDLTTYNKQIKCIQTKNPKALKPGIFLRNLLFHLQLFFNRIIPPYVIKPTWFYVCLLTDKLGSFDLLSGWVHFREWKGGCFINSCQRWQHRSHFSIHSYLYEHYELLLLKWYNFCRTKYFTTPSLKHS